MVCVEHDSDVQQLHSIIPLSLNATHNWNRPKQEKHWITNQITQNKNRKLSQIEEAADTGIISMDHLFK